MTSGLVTNGNPFSGNFFEKQWNGSNGKYETVSGRKVVKDNPYHCTILSVKRKPSTTGNEIDSQSFPSASVVWPSTYEVKLQGKLVSAVRAHDFNLAVNIAQGTQTVNMVVDNLMKIGRSLRYLRRGDVSNAARQLGTSPKGPLKTKDISGRWLEMQYGWLPMIGDTYEAVKAYHALTTHARTSRIKVRQSRTIIWNCSESPSNWTGFGPQQMKKKIVHVLLEELSAPRSLGLADPLSVAWELMPYSFVIDWFLPIGSYLDNLSVIPKLKGKFVTSSILINSSVSIPKNDTIPPYQGARSSSRFVTVDRLVTAGLTTAFPSFVAIPQAMSARRVYNAVALASQIALGKGFFSKVRHIDDG